MNACGRAFSNAKVTICLGKAFKVKSHADGDKFNLVDGETLMIAKNVKSAFDDVNIPKNRLNDDGYEYLLAKRYSLDFWQGLITSLLQLDPADGIITTEVISAVEDNIRETNTFLKTPRTGRKSKKEVEDYALIAPTNNPFDDTFLDLQDVATFVPADSEEEEGSASRIGCVEEYLVSFSRQQNQNMTFQRKALDMIASSINSIKATIGTRREDGEEETVTGSTIWNSVAAIASNTFNITTITEKLDKLTKEAEKADKGRAKTNGDLLLIHRGLASWKSNITALKNRVTTLEAYAGSPFTETASAATSTPPNLTDIENRIALLETAATSASSAGAAVNVTDLASKLKSALDRIDALEKEKDKKVIRFGELKWKSLNCSTAFIKSHPDAGPGFGLFVTFHTMAALVFIKIFGDSKFEKRFTDLAKTKMKNNRNMIAIAAAMAPIPDIYTTDSGRVTTITESSFDKIKDVDTWLTSYEERLSKHLHKVSEEYETHIQNAFGFDTKEYLLCTQALKTTHLTFEGFNNFITKTYRGFLTRHWEKKKAWAITTRLARTVLEHFSNAQGITNNEYDPEDLEGTAARYWFSAARTLDKMKEFTSVQFKNHTALSNTYSQYNMESQGAGMDDVAIDEKLKKLRDDLTTKINNKGALNKLTELEKNVSKLSNRVSDKCATKEDLKEYVKK